MKIKNNILQKMQERLYATANLPEKHINVAYGPTHELYNKIEKRKEFFKSCLLYLSVSSNSSSTTTL